MPPYQVRDRPLKRFEFFPISFLPAVRTACFENRDSLRQAFFGFCSVPFSFKQFRSKDVVPAREPLDAVPAVRFQSFLSPIFRFGHVPLIQIQQDFADKSGAGTFPDFKSIFPVMIVQFIQVYVGVSTQYPCERYCQEGPGAVRWWPHWPQNLWLGAFPKPQDGQVISSLCPHSTQNFMSAAFSNRHSGHSIQGSLHKMWVRQEQQSPQFPGDRLSRVLLQAHRTGMPNGEYCGEKPPLLSAEGNPSKAKKGAGGVSPFGPSCKTRRE